MDVTAPNDSKMNAKLTACVRIIKLISFSHEFPEMCIVCCSRSLQDAESRYQAKTPCTALN